MELDKSLGPQLSFRKAFERDQSQLWQSLAVKRHPLQVKCFGHLFELMAENAPSPDSIICYLGTALLTKLFRENMATDPQPIAYLNFHNPKGNYFFMASLKMKSESELEVVRISDLYILQRRESTRIEVPTHLPSIFEISAINDEPITAHPAILDVSAGGFKIEFLEPTDIVLESGTILTGLLTFKGHHSIEVKAEVRFSANPNDSGFIVAGMKIVEMNKHNETRYIKFLMYLQEYTNKKK